MSDTGMKYMVIIKKDGEAIVEVLDRGQHLCSDIHVMASALGPYEDEEELPEGDCPPIFETVTGEDS